MKFRGIRGLTAQRVLDKKGEELLEIEESEPERFMREVPLFDEATLELNEMNATARPTSSGVTGFLGTLIFEAASLAFPIYAYREYGFSAAEAVRSYLFLRTGMILGFLVNEWGHIAAALWAGHGRGAFNAANIAGNRSMFSWLLKYLPLGFLGVSPHVFIADMPSVKQAQFIRWGGWWLGLFAVLGIESVSFSGAGWIPDDLHSAAAVLGMVWAAIYATVSDFLQKDPHPRFYLCGILAYFKPGGKSTLFGTLKNFGEMIVIMFETLRILSTRGGQAGGLVTAHDMRSTAILALLFSVIHTAALLGLFTLAVLYFSWGAPLWLWIGVALAGTGSGIFLALRIGSGEVSQRYRIVNPKRADLTVTMIMDLIVKMFFTYIFFGKMGWTFIMGHSRFSTSSPDARATQPHSWIPATLWNLFFRRTKIWSRSAAGYSLKTKWAQPTVGHNGDMNGFYFRPLKKMISHNDGFLHPFLNGLLQWENTDLGDTINIAGLMKFLIAEGNFEASVRLAHLQTLMMEPHDSLFSKNLVILTRKFNAAFTARSGVYREWESGAGYTGGGLEEVPGPLRERIAQDMLEQLHRDGDFRRLIPLEKREDFVRCAMHAFYTGSPFEAMKNFAVKVDPKDLKWIGGADGSFGLWCYSPAYREFSVYKKGQTVSLSFDAAFERFWVSSERTVLNDGRAKYRLDLEDDAIVRITWGEDGKIRFLVYDVLSDRVLPQDQVEARLRSMAEDSLVAARPDPYEMFPLEGNIKKISGAVIHAADSISDPGHPNHTVVHLLTDALSRLAGLEQKGALPDAYPVLVFGSETDLGYATLLEELLTQFFPSVRVKVMLSDEIANIVKRFVDHPGTVLKMLQITPDTLVIPISNSGRSFDTDNVLAYLCTLVDNAVAILGDRDNPMADKLGPGRVLSTDVGGIQMAEPRTHVNEAMHALINASVLRVVEELYGKYPDQQILGTELGPQHVDALRKDLAVRKSRMEKNTGFGVDQRTVVSAVSRYARSIGARVGSFSLEGPIVNALVCLFYAIAVQSHLRVFPTSVLEYYGVFLTGILGIVPGTIAGIVLNYLFLYFFGRLVVTRLWRLIGFAVDLVGKLFGFPPLHSRNLKKRSTRPDIYIGEAKHRVVPVRQTGRKSLALGWENTPSLHAAEMHQVQHDFFMTRGDVFLGIQRRYADAGDDMMSAKQVRGNQSFREAPFTVIVGHHLIRNPDTGDVFLDLEDPDHPSVDYDQFAFDEVPLKTVKLLAELMFDSLERGVAEDLILGAHARALGFSWFVRIVIQPLLYVPVVKWVVYLAMARFPWLFRFYPYWASQGRTVFHTTATPTDMTPVQAKLAELIAHHGEANAQRLKKISLPEALNRAVPAPHIPRGVYGETASHLKRKGHSAPDAEEEKQQREDIRFKLHERYLTRALVDLDREIAHAQGNGGLGHLYPALERQLQDFQRLGYDPRLVGAFEDEVSDRLPDFRRKQAARSELRSAIAAKENFENKARIDELQFRFRTLLGRLRENGAPVNSPSAYFAPAHVKAMGIDLSRVAEASGAYVLTDFYGNDLIRRVIDSLPGKTPLILHLNPGQRIKGIRRELAVTFSAEIRSGKLVIPLFDRDLGSLVLRELKRRSISAVDVLEFSAGFEPDWNKEGDAITAMLMGAAQLTEQRLVVVNARQVLPPGMGKHYSFARILQTLWTTVAEIATSA